MTSLLESLLELGFGIFAYAALLRFLLQWAGAPFHNPLTSFSVSLSDFAVRRMRGWIPGWRGLDFTPLVWAWVLECLLLALNLTLLGMVRATDLIHFMPWITVMGVVTLLRHSLYLLMGAVFLLAVLSWVNPYSPVMPAVEALTTPFLRPLRRIVPLLGTVDLTPVILMVILQLTLTILIGALEMFAQRLM